jgi:hypothetical protein
MTEQSSGHDISALTAVLAQVGFSAPVRVRRGTVGTMNANWAIDTGDGQRLFVKQIHDVGKEQSLLQLGNHQFHCRHSRRP